MAADHWAVFCCSLSLADYCCFLPVTSCSQRARQAPGRVVQADGDGDQRVRVAGRFGDPVHDLRIHPRDRELIAGTHGRSIWIVDVLPLQQATAEALAAQAHLFVPRTAWQINQTPDEIMRDSERLIARYHDPAPFSMCRVVLAPCSPFSVTPELMRAAADLARLV